MHRYFGLVLFMENAVNYALIFMENAVNLSGET